MHGKKASDLPNQPLPPRRPSQHGAGPGFAPPLPSSPPPISVHGGQRVDVRIITDDYVSPVLFPFYGLVLII